jgi:flagellar biosynthesis protein FlhG
MADQAEELRRLLDQAPDARAVAVTSGKGGVGKTNVAVSLAIALAELGKRVILLDVDLGLANVDIILDLHVRWNLTHVLDGRKDIRDIIMDAPGGIQVVPGASGVDRLANLNDEQRRSLIASMEHLNREADFIVIDTGAGISRNTIGFTSAADDTLIVATPEPTAILDAYATIKTVGQASPDSNLHLLVNMARDASEAMKTSKAILSVSQRFLNLFVSEAGHILYDPAVTTSVRRKRPFILDAPDSPAARSIRAVARRLALSEPVRAAAGAPKNGFIRRLLSAFSR